MAMLPGVKRVGVLKCGGFAYQPKIGGQCKRPMTLFVGRFGAVIWCARQLLNAVAERLRSNTITIADMQDTS